jgi:AAA+ superfamily predicted ATPase
MKKSYSGDAASFTPEHRTPRYKIETDLIVARETEVQLDECLMRLRYHQQIYVDWNFASVDPMGRASILNFYGPPGTGKTLAAEALAGTLGMKFLHLGIAELESKFLGETAKNIQAAFEAATRQAALLFFDEADTLLGKRLSSVTQGVDNEVNAMRTTLMIELERFDGVTVFATNFVRNYDEAFRSRIGYHVQFALPDHDARIRLWTRMVVPNIPLDCDRESLIRNCADASEGFSGREIRTCMRLALPKALLSAEPDARSARLGWQHIESAIADLRRAHREVGGSGHIAITSEASLARQMLGTKSDTR